MAIEKTYIYDENSDTALSKLADFLAKKSVPDYFSKIENENGIMSCYTENDSPIMTIEYPMNTKGITIYTKNGTSVNINTGNNNYSKFCYGYTLKNGLTLQIAPMTTTAPPFAFAVTKDDEGNTVIIAENRFIPAISATATSPIYIINFDSDAIEQLKIIRYSCSNFEKTALVPFVVLGSKGNYTPNAFLQIFGHNSEQGTLEIDGVKYFSNGLWCIKDE